MIKFWIKNSPFIVIPAYFLFTPQQKKDIQAIGYAGVNALRVVPFLSISIFDYIWSLRKHQFPSEEYDTEKKNCHTRVAKKFLHLWTSN